MLNNQNYQKKDGKTYHERADATLKVSEVDIITARYTWAINQLRKYKAKTILDFGCGLGYGTNLLSKAGFEVQGIDKSETAIKTCKQRYPYIKFHCLLNLSESHEKQCDAIVAFEIIEHMDENSQYKFLMDCINILSDKGVLFLTTPNVKYSKNKNPHHLKEFSYKELQNIFKGGSIKGLVLPHIRKVLSFFLNTRYLESIHLPIFFVPVQYSEYFLIEINKESLLINLKEMHLISRQ